MCRMHLFLIAMTIIGASAGSLSSTAVADDKPSLLKKDVMFKVMVLKGRVEHAAPHADTRPGHKDPPKGGKIAPLSHEEKLKLVSLNVDGAPASTKALSSKILTITDDWWPELRASIWARNPTWVSSRRLSFCSEVEGESVHVTLYPAGNKALTAKHFVADFRFHLLSKESAEYEIKFEETKSSQKVTVAPGAHHLTISGKISDISKGVTFVLSCTSPNWRTKGNTKYFCGAMWDFDGCELTLFD